MMKGFLMCVDIDFFTKRDNIVEVTFITPNLLLLPRGIYLFFFKSLVKKNAIIIK